MSLWNNKKFGPMLLKEINEVINSKDYLYEIKYDGIRALMFVNTDTLKIISRNKKDITYLYPELKSVKELFNENVILDGEIITMHKNKVSFEKLQERSHLKDISKIAWYQEHSPVIFVAFDILYKGKDLTKLPLTERKKILEEIGENDYLIKSKVYDDGQKLFDTVKKLNIEGIVAKKKDSIYEINTRSYSWIKIKNYKKSIFIVGGYETKKSNYISLKLGEYKNNKLIYIGSASLIKSNPLYNKIITSKKVKKTTFDNYDENIIYIEPTIKCRVKYIEKTKNGQLRQPVIMKEQK